MIVFVCRALAAKVKRGVYFQMCDAEAKQARSCSVGSSFQRCTAFLKRKHGRLNLSGVDLVGILFPIKGINDIRYLRACIRITVFAQPL